jgi:hypothetical protein
MSLLFLSNDAKEAADESDEANEALQKINLFWPQVS